MILIAIPHAYQFFSLPVFPSAAVAAKRARALARSQWVVHVTHLQSLNIMYICLDYHKLPNSIAIFSFLLAQNYCNVPLFSLCFISIKSDSKWLINHYICNIEIKMPFGMDSFDLHRNGNDSNLEYSIANYRFFARIFVPFIRCLFSNQYPFHWDAIAEMWSRWLKVATHRSHRYENFLSK